jgi:hypothetical protein
MKRGKKLCSLDKANVLEVGEFWREIVTEVCPARTLSRLRRPGNRLALVSGGVLCRRARLSRRWS